MAAFRWGALLAIALLASPGQAGTCPDPIAANSAISGVTKSPGRSGNLPTWGSYGLQWIEQTFKVPFPAPPYTPPPSPWVPTLPRAWDLLWPSLVTPPPSSSLPPPPPRLQARPTPGRTVLVTVPSS
jgi:hypothetical protein